MMIKIFIAIFAGLPLLAATLCAGDFDSRMTIRAAAVGGAFTEREALRFGLVNGTTPPAGSVEVKNVRGETVFRGAWPESGMLELPPLPRGHYRLQSGAGTSSFAVLPDPELRTIPEEAFLGLDTHVSWTGDGNRSAGYPGAAGYDVVAEFVRRAGIGHIRDRISWSGTNPAPGVYKWSVYAESGIPFEKRNIRISSVYHDAPEWTKHPGSEGNRLADDLLAVYRYNRELTQKFRGRVNCWEYWNEEDIGFASNPAWEYAAGMKAAYLGFKAGDPELPVLSGACCKSSPRGYCETMLKSALPEYFDIFNYHTYETIGSYADLVGELRAILKAAGAPETMPIWFSEFGTREEGAAELPGLEPRPAEKEHSLRQELLIARLIPQMAAALQQQGVARAYFYNLMPVNEWGGSKAWGLLRRDYTVKAPYTALANFTMQLGRARLLGELSGSGYLYEQPDGTQSLLLITEAEIPDGAQVIDLFGTPVAGDSIAPDGYPVYVHNVRGFTAARPALPAGTPGAADSGRDKSVVLKPVFGPEFPMASGKDVLEAPPEARPAMLELYNLSDTAKTGSLRITGATVEGMPETVSLPAWGRLELRFRLKPEIAPGSYRSEVVFSGVFNGKEITQSVVPMAESARMKEFCRDEPLGQAGNAGNWSANSSGKMTVSGVPEESAVKFEAEFTPGTDYWAFPQYTLQLPQETLRGAAGIVFDVKSLNPEVEVMFCRLNARWGSRMAGGGFAAPSGEWEERRVFFTPEFDGGKIEKLEIGFNPAGRRFGWMIRNVRVFYKK